MRGEGRGYGAYTVALSAKLAWTIHIEIFSWNLDLQEKIYKICQRKQTNGVFKLSFLSCVKFRSQDMTPPISRKTHFSNTTIKSAQDATFTSRFRHEIFIWMKKGIKYGKKAKKWNLDAKIWLCRDVYLLTLGEGEVPIKEHKTHDRSERGRIRPQMLASSVGRGGGVRPPHPWVSCSVLPWGTQRHRDRRPSTPACPDCWAMGTNKVKKLFGGENDILYWAD